MLKMDPINAIRWKYHREGLSQREIARQIGCSRNTVRKYINQPEPEYRRKKKHSSPVKDEAEKLVETVITEWKGKETKKQRITGDKLHEELQTRKCEAGITTVREIFKERRRKEAEVFIPLIHRPGGSAQVDFFEVTVDEAGVQRKVWMFLMRLMYSKRDFVWLYEGCTQLAFLDGHVKAFEHFGGVPARCVYDNLSAAVKKVVLGGRELTDPMISISNHYLFEPCFCRVGRGNDKGGVEARGKGIRYQALTPIPSGDNLKQLSEGLMEKIGTKYASAKAEDGGPLSKLFEAERALLRSLPLAPFPVQEVRVVSVNKSSLAKVKGVTYSLPSTWARLQVTAYIRLETVEFRWKDRVFTRSRGRKGERCVSYLHYLDQLAIKPQAVRQVAPELVQELGEPYGRLWVLLVASHGDKAGAKVLAKILGAIVANGVEQVTDAVTRALTTKRIYLPDLGVTAPGPRLIQVPAGLEQIVVETARATDFDRHLARAR
jgi:transposase